MKSVNWLQYVRKLRVVLLHLGFCVVNVIKFEELLNKMDIFFPEWTCPCNPSSLSYFITFYYINTKRSVTQIFSLIICLFNTLIYKILKLNLLQISTKCLHVYFLPYNVRRKMTVCGNIVLNVFCQYEIVLNYKWWSRSIQMH